MMDGHFRNINISFLEQVVIRNALNLGSSPGASSSEMTRLGTYKTPCPHHLSSIRDLSFLPKVMGYELHWKDMRLDSLAELLRLTKERLRVLMSNPQLIRDEYPEGSEAGQALLRYRLTVQQDLPTRLKHLYSWNLNSWSIPDHPFRHPKTRRCRRLLKLRQVHCAYRKLSGI